MINVVLGQLKKLQQQTLALCRQIQLNLKLLSRLIESRQPCYDKYTISGYATETVGVTLLGFLGLGHYPHLNFRITRILLVPRSLKSVQGWRLSRITAHIFKFLHFN